MPPLVLGSFLFFGLTLLSASLGRRLLIWLRVQPADPLTHGVLATALGLGALQTVPFTLFALGTGTAATMRWCAAILFAILIPDMVACLRSGYRWLRQPRGWTVWESVIATILAVVLVCAYIHALCPVTDVDGLSYHLAAAVRLLQAHRFVLLPTLTFTNWPLGIESLFAWLLGIHPDAPVALVQYLCGVLGLLATYLLARRWGGRFAGFAAVSGLLIFSVYWEEMAMAHVDLGTTLFGTLAVLCLTLGGTGSSWARLSALFAGLAATTKLNGVWVIVAMGVLYAGALRVGGALPGRAAARAAAIYLVTAALVPLPWFLKTWVVTGNPIWPVAFSLLGGREWTAAGWPRWQHYYLLLNTPPGVSQTLLHLKVTRAALVLAGVLICVAIWRATRRSALALPARYSAVVSTLLWLGTGFILRFQLPMFPCLLVSITGWVRWRERTLAPVVCALALILGARIALRPVPASLKLSLAVATGAVGREDYLRRELTDYPMVECVNRELPPDSRILVGTWDESTAYYHPMALRPNYWLQDSIHYDSLAKLVADLTRLGVTHLVFKPMDEPWCRKSSACRARSGLETALFAELSRLYGSAICSHGDYTLYLLHLPVPH